MQRIVIRGSDGAPGIEGRILVVIETVRRVAVTRNVKSRTGLAVGEIQSEESVRFVELVLLKDTVDNLRCCQRSIAKIGPR